jgi:hypothetical protein
LVAAIASLAAIAATMVFAAPGGAASPLKEYSAVFEMPCSIAGGLVHATLKVETKAKGPEFVTEGETFDFTEATSTVHSPPALSDELANAFGATHARGFVKATKVKSIGSTPASENIAVTNSFPKGLLYEAPVEANKEEVFTAPNGTSYLFPEPVSGTAGYHVTGAAGTNTELILEHVNGGIESTLEAFNASTIRVLSTSAVCEPPETVLAQIPIHTSTEKAEYKNWSLSGALTDKKRRQTITLPEGSTFNGQGEVHVEAAKGSVSGSVSIPPFTAPLKLFGVLPLSLGVSITQAGPFEGSVAKSETAPGDEALTIPAKLNVSITSIGLVGLKHPTNCTTAEPVALGLIDTLTREELLKKGWSFTGTTTLPRFNCEGGPSAKALSSLLSELLSGPENGYALKFSAPAM